VNQNGVTVPALCSFPRNFAGGGGGGARIALQPACFLVGLFPVFTCAGCRHGNKKMLITNE